MPRKYEPVWKKLAAEPGKTVKVKALNTALIARIRKAVWKEKEMDKSSLDKEGLLIKKRYRLTCEVKDDVLFFKLELANSLVNI